jgi:phage terminase large subunit GpA-like protein
MSKSPYTFISDRIISTLEWTEFTETSQWCKDNIYLSGDVSPYTGMMSFDKTPWIEEILNDWDKPWIEEYDIMASTQVGKTTIEFCCIAKELDTDPCMMQLSIPNDNDVSNYIAKKLDPFLNGIKALKSKLVQRREEEKSRLKKATKEIPGGALFITGNTDTARRSNSVKNIFLDEVGLFGSGDVAELRGRTKFYEKTGRKIFIVSSRKYKGDEIELAYEGAYCKKELQIECKGCKKYFYPLGSKQFKFLTKEQYKKEHDLEKIENEIEYKRAARNTGRVECECGHQTTSKDIEDLVREKKVKLITVEGSDEETRHGYKLNALATGLTNYSTIVEELIDAGEDDDKLRTIYQDYFNEDYVIEFEETEFSDLLTIGNGYKEWEIPEDTYKIYMTVDTQKDHFWYEVKAVCYGVVTHTIASGRLETFSDIEDIWEYGQMLEDKNQVHYMISKMGIDRRGYNQDGVKRTDEVDAFVEYMTQKYGEDRIYATEGHPKLTGDRSVQVVNSKDLSSNRNKVDIKILKMSNIYLKNKMKRAIDRTIEKRRGDEEAKEWEGNLFYINEDIIEQDTHSVTSISYTKQYTAEVYDYDTDKKGKRSQEKTWIRVQKDNHLWDCGMAIYGFIEQDKVSLVRKPENIDISSSLDRLGSF